MTSDVVRLHVVIEQHEMGNVRLVWPVADAGAHAPTHLRLHFETRHRTNATSPHSVERRREGIATAVNRHIVASRGPDRFAPVLLELAPLTERFRAAGHRLYLVGGTVRDLLVDSGRTDFDLDLTTDARPAEIKACLAGWADAIWNQGEKFGTIGAHKVNPVTGETRPYEITTFRAEAYTDDSRKPHVVFADDIEVDLSRRDFTVNAMALELTAGDAASPGDVTEPVMPKLVDPFDGAIDLATKTLRTPMGPEVSFSDDPLRMLRAARFIARYQLQPSAELVAAVREMADRLEIVSAERIRDELDKLMVVDHPSAGLWFLIETGLADQFLPELPKMRLEHDPIHRHKDVLTHSLAVVENVRPIEEHPRIVAGERAPFDFRITPACGTVP